MRRYLLTALAIGSAVTLVILILYLSGVFTPMVALVTAFVAAVVSVRFMVGALGRYGLMPFGFYRIGLALVCLVWLMS